MKLLKLYSVFHNSRSYKCVDANFDLSQKNDVTLTRHDAKSQERQEVKTSTILCRKHTQEKSPKEFWLLSSCLSNRQKCALGVEKKSWEGRPYHPPSGATEGAIRSKMYAGYWNIKAWRVSMVILNSRN